MEQKSISWEESISKNKKKGGENLNGLRYL